MIRSLKLAEGLSLPIDVVTQTMAIVAKRRAGKSYTMRRFVEQLLHAGQQVVLVDPKGDQWGIRSSADGKGPGLPVVILGGERGDVPLEASGGEIVAKLVVEERVSIVIDLSLFRKHEVATFMTAFLENLYRLKAQERYRTPVMLVLDEADAIAPQKPQDNETRMLGAAEDIVRRGGQRGLGCVLVTQRTAVLNKNVLTQAEILVALRTIAPQDLDAMKAWIDVHGEADQKKTLMESLPALPVGDAWFWSPGWPTKDGIFKRVHVAPIETFDSGATPKPGQKRKEPKRAADVDLEALKTAMAATIEKQKADDPKELRKQRDTAQRDLQKTTEQLVAAQTRLQQLVDKPPSKASAEQTQKLAELRAMVVAQRRALEAAMKILVRVKAIDFPTETDEDRKALEQAITAAVRQVTGPIEKRVTALASRVEGFKVAAKRAEDEITALLDEKLELTVQVEKNEPFKVTTPGRVRRPERQAIAAPGDGSVTGPELKILTALAELEALGLYPADKQQLGLLAGYTNIRSGGFSEPMGRLIKNGHATSASAGRIEITDQGRAAVGAVNPPETSAELQARIVDKLTGPEKKLLAVLIQQHPNAVTKEWLGQECGYTNIRSGGFSEPLGRLNTLGIVDTPERGTVVASNALFLEA